MSKPNNALVPTRCRTDTAGKERAKDRKTSIEKFLELPNQNFSFLQVFDRTSISNLLFHARSPINEKFVRGTCLKSLLKTLKIKDSWKDVLMNNNNFNKVPARYLSSNFEGETESLQIEKFNSNIRSNKLFGEENPKEEISLKEIGSSTVEEKIDMGIPLNSKREISINRLAIPYKEEKGNSKILSSDSMSILDAIFMDLMQPLSDSQILTKTMPYDSVEELFTNCHVSTTNQVPNFSNMFNSLHTSAIWRKKKSTFREVKPRRSASVKAILPANVKTVPWDESSTKIVDSLGDEDIDDGESQIPKPDFSSGDDSRNLCSDMTLEAAVVEHDTRKIKTKCRNNNYQGKRRSVQWNSEVDVIYYAGDTIKGKVIRREMEPLREEVDQQARHNRFVKLALSKNRTSPFINYKFLDPWLTVFQK